MQTSRSDLFYADVAMPSTPHAEWVKSAEEQKSSWKEEKTFFLTRWENFLIEFTQELKPSCLRAGGEVKIIELKLNLKQS